MKHDEGAAMGSMTAAPAQLRRDQRLWGEADDSVDVRRYRQMLSIRRFEELVLSLFDRGLLQGTTHCCIGQEANCVAVAECLDAGDHVFSNHRCHGHFLARCQDPDGLLAEMLGLPSGVCRGVGGSQHLCTADFKSNGILGGTLPVAAGVALGMQLAGDPGISVVFMGDGAFGEGVVYETLNLASLWKLPLLVVCEDNGWSQSTPTRLNTAGSFADRFRCFGIEPAEIDSTDVAAVAAAARPVVDAVRAGGGPRALLIHTYRLCHHSKNDDDRPADEVAGRWALDPLVVHGRRLDPAIRGHVEEEVAAALAEIAALAGQAP